MSNGQNTEPKSESQFYKWIVQAIPMALIPALSITFALGESKKDISTIIETQTQTIEKMENISQRVNAIDKNQAVLSSDLNYAKDEISRLSEGMTSFNDDMKCLRLMVNTRGSTKC